MSLFNDFEALPASCCLSLGCIARYARLFYAMPPWSVGIAFGTAIESHRLSSCTAICPAIHSKSQEMNL